MIYAHSLHSMTCILIIKVLKPPTDAYGTVNTPAGGHSSFSKVRKPI